MTTSWRLLGMAAGCLMASCTLFQPAVPAPAAPKKAPAEMPKIPAPDAAALDVPSGYRAEAVVTDLIYPSSVDFDDQGNLLIAEAGHVYGDPSAPARILKLTTSGALEVLVSQLNGPVNDILWHQGKLYISHKGKISVLEGSEVKDLVTGLPSLGDHHNNQLTVGPDGRLYFGQGVMTNSGVVGIDNFLFLWLPQYPDLHDVPARDITLAGGVWTTINPMILGKPDEAKVVTTSAFNTFGQGEPEDNVVRGQVKANGTILRCNTNGSDLEVYAWGLRNPFGVMWSPDGKLYVSDNGFDERGSRPIANAPDAVWMIRQGAWYGFPDFAAGVPVTDKRFKSKHGEQPEFIMEKHPPVEQPFLTRPPHTACTKIDFARREFGFEGEMFMAEFGEATPVTGESVGPRGHQVVRVDPRTKQVEMFVRTKKSALGPKDMEYVATAGLKRPMDVRFSPDGSALYIVDLGAFVALPLTVPLPQPFEGTGVIWRVTKEGAKAQALPAGVSAKPSGRPAKTAD
jgi:glucose/arabinose dehydrogenase